MAIQTKPLYNVDDTGVTIRRGPSDILWFGCLMFIVVVLVELIPLIDMIGSRSVSVFQILGFILIPVSAFFWYRFTAKRYANTWVKITKDTIIFNTAGRIKEIDLQKIEKVTLDGKTSGITTYDLVMKFIMKDGSSFSYSYLGDNTFLFLNKLSMRGIPVYDKDIPYEIQLVLMDILDEDGVEKVLEETEMYLKELSDNNPHLGISYKIHRVGKMNENWGSLSMSNDNGFSSLITAKRFGQIFSYNFIEYCEHYIKTE
ncbi:MAG: hypothetical protein IJA10_15965 [Lachnospiraceae bacterium]|nr:hypothetical protein [Lachnospiraceae bacterium]MBQ4524416.1 hypothetical protein [Lachnospiraceae bacterium]